MDIILTPIKRLFICLMLLSFFMLLGCVFIRGLTEISIAVDDDEQQNGRQTDSDSVHDIGPVLGDQLNNLHIFVQISDLHLSIHHDKKRGPDFKDFCRNTIPIINPEIVLVTGDITDAKYPDKQGSVQFEEEWKQYHKILADTKVLDKTVWLDIRGNHDVFDVPSLDSETNYFKRYSVQGKKHERSYHYIHKTKSGQTFSFIGFDACPDPGPRRPFNFFGVITQDDLDMAERLEAEARSSNMTIWFSHYPTSVITGDLTSLRQTLGKGSVYLSGHLHTLAGLAPDMYARQQAGYLELEVGDWMDNRIYRVFAVDNGLFSFTDQRHDTWPVVMVTNPKHGQFIMPDKEPLGNMLRSTHIRIVAFSPSTIRSVLVSIDGKKLGKASHSEGPLYTLAWNPELYHTGLHTITVKVKDAKGRENVVTQPFSLDNTQVTFSYWRRFIIMSEHHLQGKTIFALAFVLNVLPMLLTKAFNFSIDVSVGSDSRCNCLRLYQLIIRRYRLISNNSTVYWSLLAFHFYVALGPWFIGEIMSGYVGAMFVYGVYVHGTFIPGSLTYLYGFFQLMLFNFPLTHYLAHVLDHRICGHKNSTSRNTLLTLFSWLLHHSVFFLVISLQIYLVLTGTYRAYGLMAALLCPVRTWSVVLAGVLRSVARGRRPHAFKPDRHTDFEHCAL